MDTSIEAIENDLMQGERVIGNGAQSSFYATRALIRSILRGQESSFLPMMVETQLGMTEEPEHVKGSLERPELLIEDSQQFDEEDDIFADARKEKKK